MGNRPRSGNYKPGLHEVEDGVYAYLAGQSGWGSSNAGLLVGPESSILVNTLATTAMSSTMLSEMTAVTDNTPIQTLINTQASFEYNGGNHLVDPSQIIASDAQDQAGALAELKEIEQLLGSNLQQPVMKYANDFYSAFTREHRDSEIAVTGFDEVLKVPTPGRQVILIDLGPAHSASDTIVHLPDERLVFAGGLIAAGETPCLASGSASGPGSVSAWIDACDFIINLDCDVIVAGRGPVGNSDSARDVRDYLIFVRDEATLRHEAGLSAAKATLDIELGSYSDLAYWERVARNVESVYCELEPGRTVATFAELFERMTNLKLGI